MNGFVTPSGIIMDENNTTAHTETILVVDDELFLIQFLHDVLTSKGYAVILAKDGQDAVEKYKDNMGRIDLVLMDIMMPRKDGITAHKEITAMDSNSKILLMSAYSAISYNDIEHLNFIQKPMSPNELYAKVGGLLYPNL